MLQLVETKDVKVKEYIKRNKVGTIPNNMRWVVNRDRKLKTSLKTVV
jgi:hypothetical protein